MDRIYEWFLWHCGFPDDLKISDLLAIQKQRLGAWWWCFPIITILVCIVQLGFAIWLTIHIATYKLGGLKDAENYWRKE